MTALHHPEADVPDVTTAGRVIAIPTATTLLVIGLVLAMFAVDPVSFRVAAGIGFLWLGAWMTVRVFHPAEES